MKTVKISVDEDGRIKIDSVDMFEHELYGLLSFVLQDINARINKTHQEEFLKEKMEEYGFIQEGEENE